VDRADVAQHEAVHACIAAWLGKEIELVRVARHPIPGRSDLIERGGCQIDRDRVPDGADLCAFLAAGLHEGSGIASDVGASEFGTWPPRWPVLPGPGDRGQVRAIIRLLELTEADYRDAIVQTRKLLAEPELQRWIAKVASALTRK
jgi:hypothetical protein